MKDFHNTALVVEDDHAQRSLVSMLLEESDIKVIQCESAEAAVLVLNKIGGCLSILFTDVNLAGVMNGAELAAIAKKRFPNLKVIVTSGNPSPRLPPNTLFLQKPWRALEIIRESRRLAA